MASQESSIHQRETRARKGKAPMEEPSVRVPKEEYEEVEAANGELIMSQRMRAHFRYLLQRPVIQWNYIDLSILNSFQYRQGVERLIRQAY